MRPPDVVKYDIQENIQENLTRLVLLTRAYYAQSKFCHLFKIFTLFLTIIIQIFIMNNDVHGSILK